MPALLVCLWMAGAVAAVCWVLSLVTREYSWVDRIWSIVPVLYLWIFAASTGLSDPRLVLMASLVTLWGIRLTFNFARKGGYRRGGEDYRWRILRSSMNPWQFEVFNLLFISAYQNALLLAICLPAWTAAQNPRPLGGLDLAVAAVFLAFLVGETVADQQQWNFQRWKKAQAEAGREPRPRFLQTGLFSISRHPNFFFEQAQWWMIFVFGAIAAGSLVEWTIVGPVLLTLLFIGSTRFTERISRGRYPEYVDYQARTSMLIPWPPRRTRTA